MTAKQPAEQPPNHVDATQPATRALDDPATLARAARIFRNALARKANRDRGATP